MRSIDSQSPILSSGGEIVAKGGFDRISWTVEMAFKYASMQAWVLETDFTARQFEDLLQGTAREWHEGRLRKLMSGEENSWAQLRADRGTVSREGWRSERRNRYRSTGYTVLWTRLFGKKKYYYPLEWVRSLDSSSLNVLHSSPVVLTRQNVEAFVEASFILAKVMLHGSDEWRPDYEWYEPAIARVVSDWPTLAFDDQSFIAGCQDYWGKFWWDEMEGFSTAYYNFWLYPLMPSLASDYVPGFKAWRRRGEHEFLQQVKRDQREAEAAQARQAEWNRLQSETRKPIPVDTRPWVNSVMASSAHASKTIVDIYNEQKRVIKGGYGNPNNYSW